MPTPRTIPTGIGIGTPKTGKALDVVNRWFKGEQPTTRDENLQMHTTMHSLPQNGTPHLYGNDISGHLHWEDALGLLPEIARAAQWNSQLILEDRTLAQERMNALEDKVMKLMERVMQDMSNNFLERGHEQNALLTRQRADFEMLLDEHAGQTQKLMQHELRSLKISTTQNFLRVFEYFDGGPQKPRCAQMSNIAEKVKLEPKEELLKHMSSLLEATPVPPRVESSRTFRNPTADDCKPPSFQIQKKLADMGEEVEELLEEVIQEAPKLICLTAGGEGADRVNHTEESRHSIHSSLRSIGMIFGIEAEGQKIDQQVRIMGHVKKQTTIGHAMNAALEFFGFSGFKHVQTKGLVEKASRPDCVKFVDGPYFTCISCLIIVVNAWWVGYVTDADVRARMKSPPQEPDPVLKTIARLFNLYFLLELLIRVVALRRLFWMRSDRAWNIFDAFIVTSALVEEAIEFANLGFLRILRVLRLIRVIRILRVLRFFQGLQMMIATLLSSAQVLLWTIVTVGFVVYIFAVLLLQGAYSFLDADDRSGWDTLSKHFGTVERTMYVLLASVSGGLPWVELAEDLALIHWALRPIFSIFIILFVFGFLNAVTGVFVNKALYINEHDGNLAIQRELDATSAFARDLAALMSEFESVPSSTVLQWDLFESFITRVDVQMLLQTHGIDVAGARELFKILTHQKKGGEVTIEDFVFGCQRMKGVSKAMDVILLYEEVLHIGSMVRENKDRYNSMVREVKGWQEKCIVVFENMITIFDAKLDRFDHDMKIALGM